MYNMKFVFEGKELITKFGGKLYPYDEEAMEMLWLEDKQKKQEVYQDFWNYNRSPLKGRV